MGRSRGGRSTKIHALVDGQGRVRRVLITAGQRHDGQSSHPLLVDLPRGSVLVADKAYDSRAVRLAAQARGASVNIPSQADRKHPHPFDPVLYRARNVVERAFCRLKDWRRVATRYDKLARNYLSAVQLAALRSTYLVESTP